MVERLVVVTAALPSDDSCRPAFLPDCQCGHGGTSHGIASPVRASCVLTGRPFPGARHGDRVRDIAASEHALLRAARAAWAAHPGAREDYKRYRETFIVADGLSLSALVIRP